MKQQFCWPSCKGQQEGVRRAHEPFRRTRLCLFDVEITVEVVAPRVEAGEYNVAGQIVSSSLPGHPQTRKTLSLFLSLES